MAGLRSPGTPAKASGVRALTSPEFRILSGALGTAALRFRRAADAAAKRAQALGRPILAWAGAEISPLDPVGAFESARLLTAPERCLWMRPAEGFGLAAIGSAWEATAAGPRRFATLDAAWQRVQEDAVGGEAAPAARAAGPVALYGFSFDPGGPTSPEWRGYPAGRAFVPGLCVVRDGETCRVTVCAMIAPGAAPGECERVEAWLRACGEALCRGPARGPGPDGPGDACAAEEAGPAPAVEDTRAVEELPRGPVWRDAVAAAAHEARAGRLAKVVLARAVRVRAARFDVPRALRRLRASHAGCTVFAVARGDLCFLGATPERLVRTSEGAVITSAVAGSAPRGATEVEDRALGDMLLRSRKDRTEHALVVDAIRAALEGVCATLSAAPEPRLLRMRDVQHLSTPVAGRLRAHTTVLDLAGRLHPTPAVGGVPRVDALRWIRDHEGWDRGWYAGPVGWMDRAGQGEAAVAIRSALVGEGEALLFAGCGIVADSDPDREYAESVLKFRPMLAALGGA